MASTASTGPGIVRPGRAAARSSAPLALRGPPVPSGAPSAPARVSRAAGCRSGLSAAALSGSPEGVPAGDDASLFVSFTEPCLGSAPIMALVRNPVWRGPLGVAARAGRDAAGSQPAAGHYTAKHARNGSHKETGVLGVP